MGYFWAQFESAGENLFRFDTRVYLTDVSNCYESDPIIGAIVAKNPGSALPCDPKSRKLQAVSLNGGRLLATVHKVVKCSFREAGLEWPERGYIQVFNLFYLCDKDAKRAVRRALQLKLSNCQRETHSVPWLWYALGNVGNKYPQLFPDRFREMPAANRFYFDHKRKEMMEGHPTPTAFPKHTQGLAQPPMIAHIAKLLTSKSGVF
jgi:hypothetical protein